MQRTPDREERHASAPEHVIDLIFGHWRSQILYAGVALGVFDRLAEIGALLREDHPRDGR